MIITGAPVELHGLRGRRLLGRAVPHHEVVHYQRALHAAHLLGRAGRHLSTTTASRSTSCRRSSPACSTTTCSKPSSPLVRGFDDRFWAPHSRHTDRVRRGHRGAIRAGDWSRSPMRPASTSPRAPTAATSSCSATPSTTPARCAPEYERDVDKGMAVARAGPLLPRRRPRARRRSATWRAHAQLLYTNWLNYYVYQTTPYDLSDLGAGE